MARAKKSVKRGAKSTKPTKKPAKARAPRPKPSKPTARRLTADQIARIERAARIIEPDRTIGRDFLDAFDLMRDLASHYLSDEPTLTVKEPPPSTGKHTPWLLVGRIAFARGVSYVTINTILRAWQNSSEIEELINPQRLSRIKVTYARKRERLDFTLCEIGAWELVISISVDRTDATDEESLSALYKNRDNHAITVWLSSKKARDVLPM